MELKENATIATDLAKLAKTDLHVNPAKITCSYIMENVFPLAHYS